MLPTKLHSIFDSVIKGEILEVRVNEYDDCDSYLLAAKIDGDHVIFNVIDYEDGIVEIRDSESEIIWSGRFGEL